jgi:hypothetical protein
VRLVCLGVCSQKKGLNVVHFVCQLGKYLVLCLQCMCQGWYVSFLFSANKFLPSYVMCLWAITSNINERYFIKLNEHSLEYRPLNFACFLLFLQHSFEVSLKYLGHIETASKSTTLHDEITHNTLKLCWFF